MCGQDSRFAFVATAGLFHEPAHDVPQGAVLQEAMPQRGVKIDMVVVNTAVLANLKHPCSP